MYDGSAIICLEPKAEGGTYKKLAASTKKAAEAAFFNENNDLAVFTCLPQEPVPLVRSPVWLQAQPESTVRKRPA